MQQDAHRAAGELNDSARAVEQHGGINLGHDLLGGESVLSIVDHRVGGHAGAFDHISAATLAVYLSLTQ